MMDISCDNQTTVHHQSTPAFLKLFSSGDHFH